MQAQAMISLLKTPAQVIYTQDNLFASVNLAQIADETGWLSFLPHDINSGRNSYNIYGIKGVGSAGSVSCYTQEDYGGKWVTILAQFAAYDSYLQSMQGRVTFLHANSRYAPVFAAKDAYAQAYALQDCGWATDPQYAQKIIAVINEFGLTKYDKKIKIKPQKYNVVSGWFDGLRQAQAGAARINKLTGYHSVAEKA